MICHERQLIFVHVPKTGGTSIEAALALAGPRHNTASQYRDLFPDQWRSYFSFGFVRNPWERVLSLYLFRRQIRGLKTATTQTFRDWLLERAAWVESGDRDALNREFAPAFGVGTSVRNDPDGWRVKFDNAIDMLTAGRDTSTVDFIGRFERLQDDFDAVCDRLGIERRELPHCNRTERNAYWTYYDEDCRRVVAELFSRDIEAFGYRFGE